MGCDSVCFLAETRATLTVDRALACCALLYRRNALICVPAPRCLNSPEQERQVERWATCHQISTDRNTPMPQPYDILCLSSGTASVRYNALRVHKNGNRVRALWFANPAGANNNANTAVTILSHFPGTISPACVFRLRRCWRVHRRHIFCDDHSLFASTDMNALRDWTLKRSQGL